MTTADREVAAVQAHAGLLDREATIDKVGRLTKEAAAHGAALVAFPEAFVPTYPDWVWRTTPWADGDWYVRWADQCVDVPGPACDALGAIAPRERLLPRDPGERAHAGTIYNTLLYFGPDGDAARQAPQADADRRRAPRVGPGRRLDAHGDRHAVRTRRRA